MRRTVELDKREVKKHKKSPDLSSDTSPSSTNIRQSECSTRYASIVDTCDDVTPTALQTSDLKGAIWSTDGWLSIAALRRVLDVCDTSYCRILDSAKLGPAISNPNPELISVSAEWTIIAPVLYVYHWTIAISNRDYDSVRRPSAKVKDKVLAFEGAQKWIVMATGA